MRSSPRPWGCFSDYESIASDYSVFPTPVGVFLAQHRGVLTPGRLPHARGGVSMRLEFLLPALLSSPRPWGCFHGSIKIDNRKKVFPTPVGVFPSVFKHLGFVKGLPHARGGVSQPCPETPLYKTSSPRPWGCFLTARQAAQRSVVFPTPVGVFPDRPMDFRQSWGLPHARGGVSL